MIARLIQVAIVGGLVWFVWSGRYETLFSTTIRTTVANDLKDQFAMIDKDDYMEKCMQAGMVARAYLQAKDQVHYSQWKSMEHSMCKAAKAIAENGGGK